MRETRENVLHLPLRFLLIGATEHNTALGERTGPGPGPSSLGTERGLTQRGAAAPALFGVASKRKQNKGQGVRYFLPPHCSVKLRSDQFQPCI